MATTLGPAGIIYPDLTTQTTVFNSTVDQGTPLSVSSYTAAGTYTWTPSIPTSLTSQTLTWNVSGAGAALTVTGTNPYTITNSSPTSLWTQTVYSTESGVNIFARAQPTQTTTSIMIGLTRTPGASYSAIEYALYFNAGGSLEIYESGVSRGTFGTYVAGDTGLVTYDGSYIRYYCDAQGKRPIRVVAVSGLTGLKIQVSNYSGGSVYGVQFGSVTQTQTNTAVVKVVGGGGGGSGYCESGGAGGYSEKRIDVSAVSTVTVTVGAGGVVAAYSSGNPGGTSSFGAYCSATGGYGSDTNYTHTGGHGGVGSGGDVNLYGGTGTGHVNTSGHGQIGRGGDSYWGGPNSINRNLSPSSLGSAAPGTGGTGGITDTGQVGTSGMAGAVVVWSYK